MERRPLLFQATFISPTVVQKKGGDTNKETPTKKREDRLFGDA